LIYLIETLRLKTAIAERYGRPRGVKSPSPLPTLSWKIHKFQLTNYNPFSAYDVNLVTKKVVSRIDEVWWKGTVSDKFLYCVNVFGRFGVGGKEN
jgi:hypothetical protein